MEGTSYTLPLEIFENPDFYIIRLTSWQHYSPFDYAYNQVDTVTSPVEIKILTKSTTLNVHSLRKPVIMKIQTELTLPTLDVIPGEEGLKCSFFDHS